MKINLLLVIILLCSCARQDHQLILVSFDGFRSDYLTKAETPNFDALVSGGVTSEGLIPVFPTKTFPNHYAIATGLYPENNGVIANNMYDPVMDARYRISDREAVENPEWYEGEPIWNTVEKQGKKAGTMFWVGSEAPIQNMHPTYWKIYDGDVPDSARIDSVLKWMTYPKEKKVDLGTLYFSFLDDAGHWYGPESQEVVQAIQRADSLMGYLMSELKTKGLWENTNIIIVSDHGMSALSKDRLVILDDLIDVQDVDIISFSPAVQMNVKEGKLDEVYSSLKANENHYKIYKRDDIPDRYHLKNHRRVSQLLMVADRGYTISTKSYVDSRPNYPSGGTHGFDNNDPEMHALFIGSGPGFKKGLKVKAFENIHIYELIAYLLNIEASANDGDINKIFDMLK